MTSEGRPVREAIQIFRASLNSLLANTITRMPIIAFVSKPSEHITLSFRQGGASVPATLASQFGLIDLVLHQTLEAVEGQRERFRLRITEYQYTVTPVGDDDPLFRWEFVRFPSSGSFWCRNHLQGPIGIGIGGRTVNLNDWHLPTGWVPIEEIIRFCIVDLGVQPLDTSVDSEGNPGWHTRLIESSQQATDSLDRHGEHPTAEV
jgi:hypothetical protein